MKISRISEAIGNIRADLVSGAITYKRTNKKKFFIRWGSIAACFCLILCAILIMPMLIESSPGVTPGNDDRYKDFTVRTGTYNFEFPWEFKAIYEKYTSINVGGAEYAGRRREISATFVGEKIGSYQAEGYDITTNTAHYESFDVFKIKDITSDKLLAVKMGEKYYVFVSQGHTPPTTLGGVLEEYSLSKHLALGRFSIEESGTDKTYHLLSDDEYIWSVLNESKNAESVDPSEWCGNKGKYISFTVTSEVLGVYKNVMYVTESGYVFTNAFNEAYLYFIGEDAAGRIIQYAKEYSTVEKSEPYRNTVVGKIAEITDAYILIDDSILCKNPSDGITYKIMLNDITISRYVECNIIKVGSTVVVSYEGSIDKENGNAIHKAVDIAEGIIADGDVLIPT